MLSYFYTFVDFFECFCKYQNCKFANISQDMVTASFFNLFVDGTVEFCFINFFLERQDTLISAYLQ